MAEKNNANIGFEKQIWDAACVLWGHIPAAEYRKVIIGLIFLRYISSAFERKYNELVAEGEGFEEDRDEYLGENIFFVPEKARWSTVAAAAHTPEIGTVLDEAMREIEAENKSLKNVLPKNYASPDLDKRVLGDVVDLFTNMDMSDTEEGKDLLGRTYEYCIAQFAAYEGVKGGEFYTPSSIVKTIVAILKPFNNCRVYDPCCGSGGMFVQSVKFIQAHSGNRQNISVYGQESNADTWKMAKMNMAIRGIDADFGPYQADTFFNDLHANLRADFIMANPPFNLSNWGQDKLLDDVRWKYGTPPAGNANYAWIQHMIHHLAPNGKIGLVLANGALSTQSSGEGEIRKNIINADLVEGIVALPTQLFYSVTIPVTLWFISKNKKQKGKTLFIDARKMGYMVDRKHRDFTDEDIQKLADTFEAFQNGTLEDVKGFVEKVGYPVLVRPSYVLSGAAMNVCYDDEELENFLKMAAEVSKEYPVVVSQFLENTKEIEFDAVAQNGEVVEYAISEHIEFAGVHSGDATLVFPAQKIYFATARRIKKISRQIAKELNISGPFNIQFLARNNEVKVIECNLRASRSFPFVSKVLKRNFIETATRIMLDAPYSRPDKSAFDIDWIGVKASQFSFSRLHKADPVLGVDMSSTGEVGCIGDDFSEALLNAMIATGFKIPGKGVMFSSGAMKSKVDLLEASRMLFNQGYKIYATAGTAAFLNAHGVDTTPVYWPDEKPGAENNVMKMIADHKFDLIVNIPKNHSKRELTNGYRIRRGAIDHNIPLITNARLASAFIEAFCDLKLEDIQIKSWQEYK